MLKSQSKKPLISALNIAIGLVQFTLQKKWDKFKRYETSIINLRVHFQPIFLYMVFDTTKRCNMYELSVWKANPGAKPRGGSRYSHMQVSNEHFFSVKGTISTTLVFDRVLWPTTGLTSL